jgi:nicotinamide-nucleotide amidase
VALLGVAEAALEQQGAVSEPVAQQMARGARERAGVEAGVSITGVAGPEGGSLAKPVGTVFIAVDTPDGAAARRYLLGGTRRTVRERSAHAALDLLRRQITGLPLDLVLD